MREYIPAPRRYLKCQWYNHSSASCHAQEAICVNCGELQHGRDCHSPPHCCNCDEAHPASDKDCFYYKLEKEILSTKTKDKISYGEVKKVVLKQFASPKVTFAQTLKSDNEREQIRTKETLLRQSPLSMPTLTAVTPQTTNPLQLNSKQQDIASKPDQAKPVKMTTCSTNNNSTENWLDNTTLRNILTTANISKEDNNRKRSIDTTNNCNKVAKMATEEMRNCGDTAACGSAVAITPPSVPPSAPKLKQPPHKEGDAAASARDICVSLQSLEMETSPVISPSPIIKSKKPNEPHTSGKEKRRSETDEYGSMRRYIYIKYHCYIYIYISLLQYKVYFIVFFNEYIYFFNKKYLHIYLFGFKEWMLFSEYYISFTYIAKNFYIT